MPNTTNIDEVDLSLIKNSKLRTSILNRIEQLRIVSSMLGFPEFWYADEYGAWNYSQSFFFSNGRDFIKVSFVVTNYSGVKEDVFLDITYPTLWLSKLSEKKDIFGARKIVKDEHSFLDNISEIIEFF